ncbi:hypothetical protein MKK50_08800 [Methylobacterium sp. J-043]|uniref:hypothetical protein n=1 Tax=Methylorubrum TaxID=2282523 RepID=UPI00209E6723|nr:MULTISPECIES: hypothetical protein [Methylorubrum]MCJ2029497.1 hypothetical protein [Methylobacterium sp. J-043]MCP1551458.1 hypothetical protein [Methylorubrum zatmanii]MCP1556395.1 hypothetical protein [Methylorubrum extorquens]MCP1581944.1 hypothetical protein [Methylorubrum extorquens]
MARVLDPTPPRIRMRTSLRLAVVVGGLALAGAAPAQAQSTGNNCLVRQAADAAVQRQIALIDAAKVNPSSFFNGPNSCIAGDLLRRFDLSNLIPDLSGFLTSGATSLISSVIDAAKRQVCQILDDQLRDTIRSINRQMGGYQNSLSGDLFRQLNGSISPIAIPNINGIGSYNHIQNSAFGSALNLSQPTQSASPVVIQPEAAPAAAPPISAPAPSGSNFGGMFQ